MATCYRHPERETSVSCSNCGRPICPDCMTSTPVGMRCPECSQDRTKVVRGPVGLGGGATPVTFTMMALSVIGFVLQIATGADAFDGQPLGSVGFDGALLGFGSTMTELIGVAEGQPYRIVTSGFLHSGILHLGINMFVLFFLGRLIEPVIGSSRFAAIYVVALLGGSLGALVIDPHTLTVGASGAVFGLMAAAFLVARERGRDDVAAQIGFYVVLNLVFTFSIPNISVGGHVGGLLAGGALTLAFAAVRQRAGAQAQVLQLSLAAVMALLLVAGCLFAAADSVPPGL